jgi:hypothetical protein
MKVLYLNPKKTFENGKSQTTVTDHGDIWLFHLILINLSGDLLVKLLLC